MVISLKSYHHFQIHHDDDTSQSGAMHCVVQIYQVETYLQIYYVDMQICAGGPRSALPARPRPSTLLSSVPPLPPPASHQTLECSPSRHVATVVTLSHVSIDIWRPNVNIPPRRGSYRHQGNGNVGLGFIILFSSRFI